MAGNDKVLLPIWHGVTHQEVMEYSPALAGRKAVSSSDGISKAVQEILSVIHPQESPLIVTRDYLLEWGVTLPVITDQYWLDVVEASNRVPGFGAVVPEASAWRRWSFPLPPKEGDSRAWGERLAWTAMQLNWVKAAETIPITPLTPANEVLQFIDSHAGLFGACSMFPDLLAEYAPQLTIPGFGGELEPRIKEEFGKSPRAEEWTLRRDDFAKNPDQAAYSYFHGGMFGPDVSPYEDADHAFWLLSSSSSWLPQRVHSVLLDGMENYHTWVWHSPSGGALSEALFAAKQKKFKWNLVIECDVRDRIHKTTTLLGLPDSEDQLLKRFKEEKFPQAYLKAMKQRERKQRRRNKH
jgi:hypothetical protein